MIYSTVFKKRQSRDNYTSSLYTAVTEYHQILNFVVKP